MNQKEDNRWRAKLTKILACIDQMGLVASIVKLIDALPKSEPIGSESDKSYIQS